MTKNLLIFGDSYSTFHHWVPKDRDIYYWESRTETGVTKAEQTWWHQVVSKGNFNLVLNDSWSGSTIGYTGYDGADLSRTSSFIFRIRNLIKDGFFEQNQIDTVLVFGGTNDNWANAPLGELKFDNFEERDLYNVLPAISCFLKTLKEAVPNADVYCLKNTDLKPEIDDCFEKVCKKLGMTTIDFERIEKVNEHPDKQGMIDIANKVLSVIK